MKRPLLVAVAASGGRDSTALLHCTARSARELGVQVVALHVNHGLMPEADDWLRQVRAQSKRWGVAFMSQQVQTRPQAGDSIEAWARRQRYQALADMAREAGTACVLLAHHRRDQAETWLLQALRGGGPAGLSAMPVRALRDGILWARPWLHQSRDAIEAYVRRHRLAHGDDSSNAAPRFARSRLRAVVWPALNAAFADAEQALTQSAARAHEAAQLMAEVAALDLPVVQQGGALATAPWTALSDVRRKNVLRVWLAAQLRAPVPESLLQRLAFEIPTRRLARWPAGRQELRLYRGLLTVSADTAERTPSSRNADMPDLAQPGLHCLPGWPGQLQVRPVLSAGIAEWCLRDAQVRARAGGEQFQRAPLSFPRSLKKQYQGAGIPAWQRDGPLLFNREGALLFAPGLGIDARQWAAAGTLQFALRWLTGPPPATGAHAPAD